MKTLLSLLLLCTAALLIGSPSLHAQPTNLVGNGSFESLTSQPGNSGELHRSFRWTNGNGFSAFPYGTPDLFSAAATAPNVQWPNTFAGTVVPHHGDALAGFITTNFFVPDFREYCIYQLEGPMIPGQAYNFSFWLTNGSANWYGCRGSNNIGAAFTIGAPVQLNHEPLSITPQIEITSITHSTSWVQFSFTFTPALPYTHLTMGNFRNDASTSVGVFTTGNGLSYYFLDEVSLTPVAPLDGNIVRLEQVETPDQLELTWSVAPDATPANYILERSLDQHSFMQVADLGEQTAGAQPHHIDETAVEGLQYYYRLRYTALDGSVRFSSILAATFGEAGDYVVGNVYPNPAHEHFTLDFTALVEGELAMDLIDVSGRLVHTEQRDMTIGQGHPLYNVPAGLAGGIYQARFSFEGQTFVQKVVLSGTI